MENLRYATYFHAVKQLIRELIDHPDSPYHVASVNALIVAVGHDIEICTSPLVMVRLGVIRSMLADTAESLENDEDLDEIAEVLNHRLLKLVGGCD